jgi:hypothetical protein
MTRYKLLRNSCVESTYNGEWLKFDDVVKMIMKVNNIPKETAERWINIFK